MYRYLSINSARASKVMPLRFSPYLSAFTRGFDHGMNKAWNCHEEEDLNFTPAEALAYTTGLKAGCKAGRQNVREFYYPSAKEQCEAAQELGFCDGYDHRPMVNHFNSDDCKTAYDMGYADGAAYVQ